MLDKETLAALAQRLATVNTLTHLVDAGDTAYVREFSHEWCSLEDELGLHGLSLVYMVVE